MTVTLGVKLTLINCGCCGGSYAINERFRENCEEDGKAWHCPYCRVGWGYEGNGTVQRLEKELAREKARRDQAEAAARESLERAERAEREKSALKGVVTRTKNRIVRGVCPCCNRHFLNVERHMATKHPEYQASES